MNVWGKMVMKAWLERNDHASSKWHPAKAAQIYTRFAALIERTQKQIIAEHMVERYKHSSYTAYQRANDHACSYESNSPQFQYWIDVCAAIRKISN